jgi:hypothetical protein
MESDMEHENKQQASDGHRKFNAPVLLDDDRKRTTAGDTVCFSYGIPPVRVLAKIIERDGVLIGICPGHYPDEFKLRSLRKYVGSWYKQNA